MRTLFVVVGIVIILIGGFVAFGTWESYKEFSWSDIFPSTPAKLTQDDRYAFVTSDFTADQTLTVTVTPSESSDSVLLILMTTTKYNTLYLGSSGIGQSDALAWVEPTGLGQPVSFEQEIPADGSYTFVIHPRRDNGVAPWANGIPFSLNMKVSEPMNLMLPGLALAAVGIVVLAFGVISKTKQRMAPQAPPPPPPV
jgi:hypothetical protein